MPPKQPSDLKPKYAAGEKILCFHGPLLYEAKCLDVKTEGNEIKYFVHYQGWNKNWDEWVYDTRMRKFNEAGLKKQKELEKHFKAGRKIKALKKADLQNQVYPPPEALKALEKTIAENEHRLHAGPSSSPDQVTKLEHPPSATTSKPRPSTGPVTASGDTSSVASSTPGGPTPVRQPRTESVATPLPSSDSLGTPSAPPSKRRKTRVAESADGEEGLLKKLHLKIDFPEQLKLWLVDDWDLVTRQSRLIQVPARVTVDQILDRYVSWSPDLRRYPEPIPDLRGELTAGLRDYFNVCLGSQLLYKFERLQYADVLKLKPHKPVSQVYGGIHLLRLLVNLREMVKQTKVDAKSMASLEYMLRDFLDFVDQNCNEFIKLDDFIVATAEYQRRSMC